MSDFLYVNLLNDRKLLRNIEEIPDVIRELLHEKIAEWTRELYNLVLDNISSRLKTVSGRLANSPRIEITEEGLVVEGHVYISGVPYARAQEEGAVIPPHIIEPRTAKTLAFMAASGDKVFAMRVFHPGGVVPAHYFMRDAYRQMSPRITRRLRSLLVERVKAGLYK